METSSRALKVKKRRAVLGLAAWKEGDGRKISDGAEWDRYEGGSGDASRHAGKERGRKIIKRKDITRLKCRWPNAKEMVVK